MFGEHTKNLARVGIIFGAILSVFFLFKTVNEIKAGTIIGRTNVSNTISVTGKGEVVAIPDIATVSFSVTESAKTVAEAQRLATEKTNKAIALLKGKEIAEKDIATENYSFYPKYEYNQGLCTQYGCSNGKQVLIGYEVSQSVSVKIRKTDIAGEILTGLGALNVQNLSGLSFSVDKREVLEREARQKAITEAQTNAEQLAKDLGVHLVGIVSYNEGTNYPMPYYAKATAVEAYDSRAGAPAPELPKGETKIISNVTIVYEIR